MKIKVFDKILLVLFLLINIALAGFAIAVFAGFISFDWNLAQIPSLELWIRIVVIAGCALYLILLFKLLFMHEKRAPAPTGALIQETVNGDVQISLQALTSMALRAARSVQGVRDVKCNMAVVNTGTIVADINASLLPDINIPETTAQVQSAVKANIEQNAGVTVQTVRVYIEDAQSVSRAIVE